MVDSDESIKVQAGVKQLEPFINVYEAQTLKEMTGFDIEEVYNMDDVWATQLIVANRVSSNYERRYMEIKNKKK